MKSYVVLSFLVIMSFLSVSQDSIVSLLPDPFNLPGLQISGEPKVYEGDYLFDLINGGADVYFEYGFIQVVTQAYNGITGQSNVKVEIYQMTDKKAAFGMLSLSATGKKIIEQKGVFSVSGSGYKMMQKGDYFIIISYANLIENTEDDLVNRISADIGSKIKEMANYPAILNDTKTPCPGTQRWLYFKGDIALRNATYLNFKTPFKYTDGLYFKCDVFDYIVFKPEQEQDFAQLMDLLISNILKSNTTFSAVRELAGASIKEDDKLRFDVRIDGETIILIKYI